MSFDSVRAIYFDLDDTLCGYWDASKAGLRKTFADNPIPNVDANTVYRTWATAFRAFAPVLKDTGWYDTYLKEGGPTRTEQMRRMLALLDIEDEALAVRLSEDYLRNRDANLKLFDDAIETLDALHKRFPLGLITNGPADIQRMEIATLGIGDYFRAILIEGEMGEGKPKPSVFRLAESMMSCQPHEVLMVGNSYGHDIRAAIENGWRAIWIRRPSDVPPSASSDDVKPEEMPEGAPAPDAVISDLRSLIPLLAGSTA